VTLPSFSLTDDVDGPGAQHRDHAGPNATRGPV